MNRIGRGAISGPSCKRRGSHIFYNAAAWVTVEGHVDCHDCAKNTIAQVIDFFNPLAIPKDIADTYDAVAGDDAATDDGAVEP